MKKISDAARNLTGEDANRLAQLLRIEPPPKDAGREAADSILTHVGFHHLLGKLSREELQVLTVAFSDENGVTYGDIDKALKMEGAAIEAIANSLSRKLLVYVLKNRQRLHNKLDKIYLYPEIRAMLLPYDPAFFREYAESVRGALDGAGKAETPAQPPRRHRSAMRLLRTLFENGGFMELDELLASEGRGPTEEGLAFLSGGGMVAIRHRLEDPFTTFVFITPELYPVLAAERSDPSSGTRFVSNGYYFLLDMLSVFDIVSSSGLFITRQREFRKIDWKRLTDALLTVYDQSGEPVPSERLLRLCLYAFHRLKCVRIKRDAVVISLSALEKELDSPLRWLVRIMRSPLDEEIEDGLFAPPFSMPRPDTLSRLCEIIMHHGGENESLLFTRFIMRSLSGADPQAIEGLGRARTEAVRQYHAGMRILCLFGITETRGSSHFLSEIGMEAASRLSKTRRAVDRPETEAKSVYINPDFMLIIPRREVPAEAVYLLAAHSDIIKDDLMLHTRISRNSVVRADKRGMSHQEFIAALEKYARNGIPQNLGFLLNEWSAQTVRVRISDVTLLHCSHPGILDELLMGLNPGVAERLAPHYAVIDRKSLDQVVRAAQKKDAVLTLFEESDGGD